MKALDTLGNEDWPGATGAEGPKKQSSHVQADVLGHSVTSTTAECDQS